MSIIERCPLSEVEADLTPAQVRWFPRAIRALMDEGVPFLMAGAFGLCYHTGFWRGTKDMDVLVLPEHREHAIEAITHAGFQDLFSQEPYDREWLFRGVRHGVIVDLIWQLANKEDNVDQSWFDRATPSVCFGIEMPMVSAADMCWMKLFVFQRNRCDWPDIINVIRGTRGNLDWDHLLKVVGFHWRLLCALVNIYDWLCPPERHFIPDSFRDALQDRLRHNYDAHDDCRRDLLDTRPWLTQPGASCANADSKLG